MVALIWAHIRLDVHPARWKLAKGVIIPKPGKDDYAAAKSYRCIALLNCLGKMVEKVAAYLISEHCEASRGFHPGQYGCRAKHSAVDGVGVAICSGPTGTADPGHPWMAWLPCIVHSRITQDSL